MKKETITLLLATAAAMNTMAQEMSYPQTKKDATVDTYFGEQVADPYRWLENDTSAETKAWVEAENEVTFNYLKKIPFRDKLLKRLREVQNYERAGVPFYERGKWYCYKNDGLQNQSVLYQMDSPNGEKRLVLDPNKLSDDGTVAMKAYSISKDGRYMAYVVSRSGSDWNEIYVKDLQTGQLTGDHIGWTKFSGAEWLGDGFFYSGYDAPEEGKEYSNVNEGHKVFYHKLGTPQSDDQLFYQNPAHPRRFYNVVVNEEEDLMLLLEGGEGSGENIFVRNLKQPNSQLIQMTSDMNFSHSVLAYYGDTLIISTNEGAPRGKVMLANLKNPGISNWKEIIGEKSDALVTARVIDGHIIAIYNQDAIQHAYVYTLDGRLVREVKLPSVGMASFIGKRNRKECFVHFTSFTTPGTVYSYDIESDKLTPFYTPKVNFRPSDFETQQVFFTSKDGTRVPMTLTYKKGLKRNGCNPVLLYGYGGFNISLPPNFSAMRIPFLESGGIYAQVNLRGGEEYGEEWHLAGTKMRKQNVFDDFISAAEWLIENRYTNSEKLAMRGGSNGGLLVGACMTQRPDLFKVAVPQVGVMDMLRYHKFTIGWNWAPDYGTSDDSPEMFRYLRAYSPLHNLKPGTAYPATLITTADHDDRVVPAHSFKFAATLQACHKGSNPVLIRIDSKAGHGSGKPIAKVLEEEADIYGFIMQNLGMKK